MLWSNSLFCGLFLHVERAVPSLPNNMDVGQKDPPLRSNFWREWRLKSADCLCKRSSNGCFSNVQSFYGIINRNNSKNTWFCPAINCHHHYHPCLPFNLWLPLRYPVTRKKIGQIENPSLVTCKLFVFLTKTKHLKGIICENISRNFTNVARSPWHFLKVGGTDRTTNSHR